MPRPPRPADAYYPPHWANHGPLDSIPHSLRCQVRNIHNGEQCWKLPTAKSPVGEHEYLHVCDDHLKIIEEAWTEYQIKRSSDDG
jgi:hypothetical protein